MERSPTGLPLNIYCDGVQDGKNCENKLDRKNRITLKMDALGVAQYFFCCYECKLGFIAWIEAGMPELEG